MAKPNALQTIHSRIERERLAAQPKAEFLRTYRNYARGQQRSTLNSDQMLWLSGVTNRRVSDNVCRMILRAMSSRVNINRWVVNGEPTIEEDGIVGPGPVAKWLTDFWVRSKIPLLAQQIHWPTIRDGNAACVLAWDNETQRVRVVRERWWDGFTGIWVAYDDFEQPEYAVKDFNNMVETTGEVRKERVVYYRDRIEHYILGNNVDGWRPADSYEDDDGQVVTYQQSWVNPADQSPLGIPVIHFRNVALPTDSDEDDAVYGVSELAGGILGLQDEINDIQRDVTAASRLQGFALLTATGVQFEQDTAGNIVPPKTAPGSILSSSSADARFGSIPPGDVTQLDKALVIKVQAVSRSSSTPYYLITGGDWPSGAALIQSNQPLIQKVEAFMEAVAPEWSSLAHKATVLFNVFGGGTLDTDALIRTEFRPADGLDPMTRAQVAAAEAPYISTEEGLRMLDKTPDQQRQILLERLRAQELADAKAAKLAEIQAQKANTTMPPKSTNGDPNPVRQVDSKQRQTVPKLASVASN